MFSSRRALLLIVGVSFVSAVLAHVTSLGNGFVWDDMVYFETWAHAHHTITDVFTVPPAPTYHYYRPIVFLSAFVERLLWGQHPLGYHASKLLMHGTAAALVGAFVWQLVSGSPLGERQRFWVALTAGTGFAVFPWNVEAVSWVFSRGDVIATILILAGLLSWMRWADRGHRGPPILAALFLLAALLTKETALVFLPLLVVVSLARSSRKSAHWLMATLPFIIALGLYVAARLLLGPGTKSFTQPVTTAEPGGLLRMLRALGFYFTALVRMEQTPFLETLSPSFTPFGILMVIALPVVLYVSWRHGASLIACGVTWFAGTLVLPVLSALSSPAVTIVAYRHLYLPTVGLAIMAGAAIGPMLARRPARVPRAVAVVVALVCVWLNVSANRVWKNDMAFWTRAVETQPDSHIAYANLAAAHASAGETERALELYRQALERNANQTYRAITGTKVVKGLLEMGRVAEASQLVNRELARLSPKAGSYFRWLFLKAKVEHQRIGSSPSARELDNVRNLLIAARTANPSDSDTYIELGHVEEERDEPELAAQNYSRALELLASDNPRASELKSRLDEINQKLAQQTSAARRAYFEGQRAMIAHEPEDAAASFERAVHEDPEMTRAWLMWAQSTAATGDPERAMHILHRAAGHASAPEDADRIDLMLGNLLLRSEHAAEALEAGQRVLQRAPNDPDAHWLVVQSLQKLGRLDEAEPHLEAFVKNWRGEPRIAMHALALERQLAGAGGNP